MANEINYGVGSTLNMYRHYSFGFEQSGAFGCGKWDGSLLTGAVRFTNIILAQAATVLSADIRIYKEYPDPVNYSLKFKLYGLDEDNTANFSSSPLGRPKTTAYNQGQTTMNLNNVYVGFGVKDMLEEIVARPNWVSGNALGFIMEDNGTDNNVIIYDQYDGVPNIDPYLVILTETRPDFYPAAVTVTAPNNIPDPRNIGIKVAIPGVDVTKATEKEIHFSTSRPILKASFYGLTEVSANEIKSIPHRLGYKGAFLVFGREIKSDGSFGGVYKLPAIIYSAGKLANMANVYIGDNDLKIETSGFEQGAESIDMKVYFYIFIDDISL